MMLGVVMLAHEALDRAAQTVRYWSRHGCEVVVHVDRNVASAEFSAFAASTAPLPGVRVLDRRVRCSWGTWSVVDATLKAVEALLSGSPNVSHVLLVSGACLPLRPPRDLLDHLRRFPDTDLIESVDIGSSGWARGGFDTERFAYRFPFSHTRQRRLFDLSTRIQRRFRVRRTVPEGLVPHLGSQWWCLTRETLERILNDPARDRIARYFRQVWIPDESYFQTLVRRHGRRVQSRSPTFSRFDAHGKPHLFYDDHAELLRDSGCFLARKIWPGADGLYRAFLSEPARPASSAPPDPGRLMQRLDLSRKRHETGRPGLYMQSRFPCRNLERTRTAAPYWVFWGLREIIADFDRWLASVSGATVHGHLFAPESARFASGSGTWTGGLSAHAGLRDYNPCGFLTNLLWAGRDAWQCFHVGPDDTLYAMDFMAGDPNARITLVTGAWVLPLARERAGFDAIRRKAIRLDRSERRIIDLLQADWVRAEVRIRTLSDVLADPVPALLTDLGDAGLLPVRAPVQAPVVRSGRDAATLLIRLRDSGLNLDLPGTGCLDLMREARPAEGRQLKAVQ